MSKPTMLLVGGAWHTHDYLMPLAAVLQAAGHPVVCCSLPSVGANPPKSDFGDDVAAIRSAASRLISEKKRVLAVLHSYGGIVGTEALQGFKNTSTDGAGVIIGLLYIATMLPKKGESFEAHLESVGDFSWKNARRALAVDGMMASPPGHAANMFYNDVEREHSRLWAALLKAQSVGPFLSPLTHETYRDIPSAYLFTTNDQAFKYKYQLQTVERADITVTKTMATGHSPWLSKPEEVRAFILSFLAELDASS